MYYEQDCRLHGNSHWIRYRLICSLVRISDGDQRNKAKSWSWAFEIANANLTDDQLIAKTRDLEEIKALLGKYPDANVLGVSRLYEYKPDARNIGVGYEVERTITIVNGTSESRSLVVIVGFDRSSNKTLYVQFSCHVNSEPVSLLSGYLTVADIENNICFK